MTDRVIVVRRTETKRIVVTRPDPRTVVINRGPPGRDGQDGQDGTGSGSGAVDSVFGRTGVVVAEAGDYAVADVTGLTDALAAKADAADLTAEASARATADDALAGDLATEAGLRAAADAALAATDAALDSRLDTAEADIAALETADETEANARLAADTALDTRLDAEEATSTAHETRLDALEAAPGTEPSRATVTVTTSSLATGASETLAVALGKSSVLHKVTTSRAAHVRGYATAARRTADAARSDTTAPAAEVLEFQATTTASALSASPAGERPLVANLDSPVATTIYLSVRNDGALGTVQVDLTRVLVEA